MRALFKSEKKLKEETLNEKLNNILPGVTDSDEVPFWPADVFCLCAVVLHCTGAYSIVVDDKQAYLRGKSSSEREASLRQLGAQWRRNAVSDRQAPKQIRKWWKQVLRRGKTPLSRVSWMDCVGPLLNLLAAADEASRGAGIDLSYPYLGTEKPTPTEISLDEQFLFRSQILLLNPDEMGQIGSTLCVKVHTSRGRVLPRMHTPQNGLTVRSFSHHLAYCPPSDIKPSWFPNPKAGISEHSFNLLVIPWPKSVDSAQFKSSRRVGVSDEIQPGGYGLFTYRMSPGPKPKDIQKLIEKTEKQVGTVHGIVFPELSMSESEFRAIAKRVIKPERLLVAGIGEEAQSESQCGKNEALILVAARLAPGIEVQTEYRQKKHHRWKLTKSQIVQYGIGTNLNPEADWWEHISLEARSLAFLNFRPWLTCSVLICEDLARPDPVGDLLRAVGPNLVIALLSDGPQLRNRWPSRYAGAFADDPGCSVLTITSAGMSRLSRANDGTEDRSGVIALWRDPKNGEKELEITDSVDALALNLTVRYDGERTADGRGDDNASGYPILSGYHLITLDKRSSQRSGK